MVEIVVGIDYMRLDSSEHHIRMMNTAFEVFHNRMMGWKWMDIHIGFGAYWHSRIVGPESVGQHNCIEIELVVDSKSSVRQSNIVS